MSFVPTEFRPLTRGGFGGRAASHFRGALVVNSPAQPGFNQTDSQSLVPSYRGQIDTVGYRSLGVTINLTLAGVTRDSVGGALGFCRVELFQTGGDMTAMETTSDASGNFSFVNPGSGPFYLVAYKAGSPDVAGTTVNTLIGV